MLSINSPAFPTRFGVILTLLLAPLLPGCHELDHQQARRPHDAAPATALESSEPIAARGIDPADPFIPLREKRVLFNGWGLTPAGNQVKIGSMAYKMVLSPDGTRLLATSAGAEPGLAVVDVVSRKQTQWIPLTRAFNGIGFSHDGKQLYITGGNSDKLYCFDYADGAVKPAKTLSLADEPPTKKPKGKKAKKTPDESFLAGLAVHPTNGDVYICSEATNEIWVVDPNAGAGAEPIKSTLIVGDRPASCIFGIDNRHLYVSNWGGRNVSVVDTQTGKVVRNVAVGIRPNDMALAPDGRLFVACAGDNTVHVLQTQKLIDKPRETDQGAPPDESGLEIISTALYPQSPEGSTPVGVAVSADGKSLFVVNADNNDVMVADISNPKVTRVGGFVPVGWYPTAVLAYKDQLLVANGKGLSSRENTPPRSKSTKIVGGLEFDAEAKIFEGWVSFIDRPDAGKMTEYTAQVRKNSPYTPETFRRPAKAPTDNPIPARVGGESPIKYILYVIKENRTYDQVFGDMTDASGKPIGNGEPKLAMFPEKITPNHHQLARDYVLLDNLYCNGEVSVDGHSWCDAAMVTDAKQKGWVLRYTQHGGLQGNKEMLTPSSGNLWDHCKRNSVTFKCYGEGASEVPADNRGSWSEGRDTEKAKMWIKDLHNAEQTGVLPSFMIMSLGEDHTKGTAPGAHTPQACVASNDLALARIVEAASKSKFWNEMAIFIVEDDAQNGPDHVDSHRTVGLVVSPWVKRGVVDSTSYTQVSMVRTIELILGMPPMTQYDAGATPMYSIFQNQPAAVAYTPKIPEIDLAAVNSKDAPGAKESARMNFEDYDDAPEDELNRILWASTMGVDAAYPIPVHRAVFVPADE